MKNSGKARLRDRRGAKVASRSMFKDIPRWRKRGKKQIRPGRLVRPLPA